MDMQFSNAQQAVIDKAIELLEPLAKEKEISDGLYYFLDKDGNDLGEQSCDDQQCVRKVLQRIRKNLPKYSRVRVEYSANDGDHERIEICHNCYKPLNEFLTWVRDELETIDNLIDSKDKANLYAFDAYVILSEVPSADHRINNWDNLKTREYKEKRQKKLAEDIVKFAKKIIGFYETAKV